MEESEVLEIGESLESQDNSSDSEELLTQVEDLLNSNQVDSTLISDTCIVICDYLPKVYVSSLFLLGALIFAFIYKVIKSFTNHFV